jgi:hypothetical protein
MMKHWTADVVACSDGTVVSPQAMRKLEQYNVPRVRSLFDLSRVRTESSQRLCSRVARSHPGQICFSRPAVTKHPIFPRVSVASVVKEEALPLTPLQKRQACRVYMWQATSHGTFFL